MRRDWFGCTPTSCPRILRSLTRIKRSCSWKVVLPNQSLLMRRAVKKMIFCKWKSWLSKQKRRKRRRRRRNTRRKRRRQREVKVKRMRMTVKKEENLITGSVLVTSSDKRKQETRMGKEKERGPWRKEKSHLRERGAEIGEGAEKEGEDHPLLLPGGNGQGIEGGGHAVRLV